MVDELELRLGRGVRARAAPDGADAAVDRRARIEMRHRMHAERKRDVRAVVGGGADQRPGTLEGEQAVHHVLGRARVEKRPAGGAARAPVLDHLGARLDAELVVEALGRDLAQLLLGEERDPVPDVFRVSRGNALLQEGRAPRALERDLLAFAVDALDLGARLGPARVLHAQMPRYRCQSPRSASSSAEVPCHATRPRSMMVWRSASFTRRSMYLSIT